MHEDYNSITAAAAAAITPFLDGLQSLVGWAIVAIILTFADLRFGIAASKKRGEKIRGSRAARRTINKVVDYICWIAIAWALGGSFGKIFDVPLLAAIVMLVVCSIEISSIFDNYFEYKGINKKFNIWKFFSRLLRIPAIEDSIEDKKPNQNETN